jgi:hypothetical protein
MVALLLLGRFDDNISKGVLSGNGKGSASMLPARLRARCFSLVAWSIETPDRNLRWAQGTNACAPEIENSHGTADALYFGFLLPAWL